MHPGSFQTSLAVVGDLGRRLEDCVTLKTLELYIVRIASAGRLGVRKVPPANPSFAFHNVPLL
jgi:hypothetical protein